MLLFAGCGNNDGTNADAPAAVRVVRPVNPYLPVPLWTDVEAASVGVAEPVNPYLPTPLWLGVAASMVEPVNPYLPTPSWLDVAIDA